MGVFEIDSLVFIQLYFFKTFLYYLYFLLAFFLQANEDSRFSLITFGHEIGHVTCVLGGQVRMPTRALCLFFGKVIKVTDI